MKKNEKRCKKCFLMSSIPGVVVDDAGICNICARVEKTKIEYNFDVLENKMKTIFKSIKKKKNKYDVLVQFSGGTDSTYLLYILKYKYGLNPLAMTIMYP